MSNPAVKVVCVVATVTIVAVTAGCSHHHPGVKAPTTARAVALFQTALAAAERHDSGALCATAEYAQVCHDDLAARPFPRLSGVHSADVRVVDNARVVRVCGKANGQPFATDYPVTQYPDGKVWAVNPVFWTPMTYLPKPPQGALVSPPTSPPAVTC